MRLKALHIIMLLAILSIVFQPPTNVKPANASDYTAVTWTGDYVYKGSSVSLAMTGQRLVAHDFNAIVSNNYYAMLYMDTSGNLNIRATDINLVFHSTQTIANSLNWVTSNQFTLTNIDPVNQETFYAVYERGLHTLFVIPITYNYLPVPPATTTAAGGQFNNFTLGSISSVALSAGIQEAGIMAEVASDGSVWVVATEFTSVYQIELIHLIKNNDVFIAGSSNVIPITSIDVPQVALTLLNQSIPYLFVSGLYHSIYGALYAPLTSSTPILTTTSTVIAASGIDLADGSLRFPYAINGAIDVITVTSTGAASDSGTLFTGNVIDIGAYALFNNQFGFFWLSTSSILTMYFGAILGDSMTYSNPVVVSTFTANQIKKMSVDPNGDSRINVAHPQAMLFNVTPTTNNYFAVANDLPSIQNISFFTFSTQSITSTSTTSTSVNTVPISTSTVVTHTNVTVPQTQSPTFLGNLALTFGMFFIPAVLFGGALGFLGFLLGIIMGAVIGQATGNTPSWINITLIIIIIVVIIMFPDETIRNIHSPLLSASKNESGGEYE